MRVGDLLVTPATGAYCFTMANTYNGQPRPPENAVFGAVEVRIVRNADKIAHL